MLFKSYDKIEENFKSYPFSEDDYRLFNKIDWVVTEKIHGANFCVLTNGAGVQYAKRKEVLEEDEDFFSYKSVMLGLELQFGELFDLIQKDYSEITSIAIYGELFGGGYPHPDVTPNPDVALIQTGIYYSPNIEYCIFDIGLVNQQEQIAYMDYDVLMDYCQQVNLPYAEPLLIGKFTEATNYDIHFESMVAEKLGYPKLNVPNQAEGVVIKPLKTVYVSSSKGQIRPVLKRKIETFSESKYTQAESWNSDSLYKQDNPVILKQQVLGLITENRLNNAISKVGKVKATDTKKVAELQTLLWEDIREEIDRNFQTDWQKLPQKQKTVLLEELQGAVDNLLKQHL